jgi:CRP-like cAMP-binding protein/sugar phosphate permease
MMITANLLGAAFIIPTSLLIPFNIVWLYILVALLAVVGQFFNPAHATVLSEIASEEELNAANSLMAISTIGALLVGNAVAGIITSRFPIEWAFYINVLLFLFSALLIWQLRMPRRTPAAEDNSELSVIFHNLRVGLNTTTSTPILRSLFLVFIPIYIALGFTDTIRLPFTIEVLKASEFGFSLIESVGIIGFVAASILLAKVGDRLREGQWITLSFVGFGLMAIVFALNSGFFPALLIGTIDGFVYAPAIVAYTLVIQRYTPREVRGRVFSVFFVSRDAWSMIGMALAAVGDIFDLRWLYLTSGIVTLGVGLFSAALPGLGRPAAEWRRALAYLRTAPTAPGLGFGRLLQPADFDRLIALIPSIGLLVPSQRSRFIATMTFHEVAEGTAIIHRGEASDAAYFILDGQAIAGWQENGGVRVLETLGAGDFFGEIAALTGVPRTADVVTEQATTLIKVPATLVHEMAAEPQLNRLFMSRLTERMLRMNLIDVPRRSNINQEVLRDLRTPDERLEISD